MRRLSSLFMMFFIIFISTISVFAQTTDVYITSTSDMHGHIFKEAEKKTIGYGNVLSIKKLVPDSLIVDGGDFLGDVSQKKTDLNKNVIYAMNKAGYEYALLGENEAKYSYEEIKGIFGNADFEILGANITYEGKRVFKEEKIKEKNGIKIGIFGVSEKIEGTEYEYEDPVSVAYKCVRSLRSQGAKAIVAVVYAKDNTLAQKIAKDCRDITLIIESGTHNERKNGNLEGRTLITNTGANGSSVNVSKITYTNGNLSAFETTNYNLDNINSAYPGENELEIKMKDAQQTITDNAMKIIAVIDEPLLFDNNIYSSSTKLGNFICDIIKKKTNADVVLLNSSNFSGGLEKNITKDQINNIFSDNNKVTLRTISGKNLYKVMEIAVNKIVADEKGGIDAEKSISDRFLQVSGITVKYNPENETGKRIISLHVGDKKVTWVNEKDEYTIAATEDVFKETNQYLYELEVKERFSDATEIVEEYLKSEEKNVKLTDEKRVENTNEQKTYWWVIGLVLCGFVVVVIIVFIIARIIMFFA